MALWRLYYHFVWATKERADLITPEIESGLFGFMIGKATSHQVIVHALGGTETHVHVVASAPPSVSLSMFVKSVKGSSAHHVNHEMPWFERVFRWQRGYGVFSLGEKQLDVAVAYVQNQKEHHRVGKVIGALEKIADDDDGPWDAVSSPAGPALE